ncbi:MAG TPA: cyclase family protein [Gemmatimonadaceae bacterium]|nr:cyclase family protein [Gemmatimonadaceae bacterium]
MKPPSDSPHDGSGIAVRLRDISVTLSSDTPEWPGDTPFSCGWTSTTSNGASVNLSTITCSPHVGTHADAPLHVRDGWPGSHELPLEAFYGAVTVIDVSDVKGEISFDAIEPHLSPGEHERLILKTGCTVAIGTFPDDWPTLSESCARTLLGLGLKLLGVDAPSVDQRDSKSLAVHKMLFAGNAFIIENLDLRRTPAGDYDIMAFPVKMMSLDAAPVRAVLLER